ncbi:MAG: YggS family pyridoxal phosphate-dependent enzyme [Alicyclobacillaceae bacterium]|nr:YggS family pyridoxal phosphate-dependent enzyme [Alicyclobacillaceae bacterium]
MPAPANPYAQALRSVCADVERACAKSGRRPQEVRVVAVTKYVDNLALAPLLAAGIRDFGENRWQQAREKLASPYARQATWHFIGHLQSNKAGKVASVFDWIHSIDSQHVAALVSRAAEQHGRTVNGLIQVNVAGEASKSGVPPEQVRPLAEALIRLPGLRLRGLMTIAPATDDPESVRPVFRELARLLRDLQAKLGVEGLKELSMGMSNDFGVAVEEGATIVRIGRRLVLPGG